MGAAFMQVELKDLRVGDLWTSDKDDVEVESVEFWQDTDLPPMVRFTGKITRGYGKSRKISRRWSFPADMRIDVLRYS